MSNDAKEAIKNPIPDHVKEKPIANLLLQTFNFVENFLIQRKEHMTNQEYDSIIEDAISFDTTLKSLDISFRKLYRSYTDASESSSSYHKKKETSFYQVSFVINDVWENMYGNLTTESFLLLAIYIASIYKESDFFNQTSDQIVDGKYEAAKDTNTLRLFSKYVRDISTSGMEHVWYHLKTKHVSTYMSLIVKEFITNASYNSVLEHDTCYLASYLVKQQERLGSIYSAIQRIVNKSFLTQFIELIPILQKLPIKYTFYTMVYFLIYYFLSHWLQELFVTLVHETQVSQTQLMKDIAKILNGVMMIRDNNMEKEEIDFILSAIRETESKIMHAQDAAVILNLINSILATLFDNIVSFKLIKDIQNGSINKSMFSISVSAFKSVSEKMNMISQEQKHILFVSGSLYSFVSLVKTIKSSGGKKAFSLDHETTRLDAQSKPFNLSVNIKSSLKSFLQEIIEEEKVQSVHPGEEEESYCYVHSPDVENKNSTDSILKELRHVLKDKPCSCAKKTKKDDSQRLIKGENTNKNNMLNSWKEIRCNNLGHAFELNNGKETKEVLRGIDFQFRRGKQYMIHGTSGNGKSTLFRILVRYIDEPLVGSITVDGCLLNDIDQNTWRDHMQYISQHASYVDTNIKDCLLYGSKYHLLKKSKSLTPEILVQQDKELKEAYDATELSFVPFEDLDKTIMSKLSGGQKQRVLLAKCFLMKKSLILLDESMSALDEHMEERITKRMIEWAKKNNSTIVCISHRQKIRQLFDYQYNVPSVEEQTQKSSQRQTNKETSFLTKYFGGVCGKVL